MQRTRARAPGQIVDRAADLALGVGVGRRAVVAERARRPIERRFMADAKGRRLDLRGVGRTDGGPPRFDKQWW